jgi:hypothetical protein
MTEPIIRLSCLLEIDRCAVHSTPRPVGEKVVRFGERAYLHQERVRAWWDIHALGHNTQLRTHSFKTLDLIPARRIGAGVRRSVTVHCWRRFA